MSTNTITILDKLKAHHQALKATELSCSMLLGSDDVLSIIAEMEKVEPFGYWYAQEARFAYVDEAERYFDSKENRALLKPLFTHPQPQAKCRELNEEERDAIYESVKYENIYEWVTDCADVINATEKAFAAKNNLEIAE